MLKPRKIPVAHPGEILQMILTENGITQTLLADHLAIPQTKVSEICRGRRGLSAEMALKLEKALGVSARIWLTIQKNWELSQVEERKLKKVRPLRGLAINDAKLAA